MNRRLTVLLLTCLFTISAVVSDPRHAIGAAPARPDLAERLGEIYQRRAQWLLTDANPPPLEAEYHPDRRTAAWALKHEQGKIRYLRLWAENRGVKFIEARPQIRVRYLSGNAERARFYVAQSLMLGYVYPGEEARNRFGVGTRHIIELRKKDDRWLIALEWYTDPLGDDTETPDISPATVTGSLPPPSPDPVGARARGGYDRAGAVRYADQYCGLAWGCGNEHSYNTRFRNYDGEGGDCANYASQVLRLGGKLNVPIILRVSALASHLQYTGRAAVTARQPFHTLWKRATALEGGFRSMIRPGDLIAHQDKGKLVHFSVVTGHDSRGYPLVNSHSADRYRAPFDLGWDRRVVYWFFRMRD